MCNITLENDGAIDTLTKWMDAFAAGRLSLERRLGYAFSDPAILARALTHVSMTNGDLQQSYEMYESLGDSVLSLVVTDRIINGRDKTPHEITQKRASIVNNVSLAACADRLGLHPHISVSPHVASNQAAMRRIKADVCEAIIGAVWIDSCCDLSTSRRVVDRIINGALETSAAHFPSLR